MTVKIVRIVVGAGALAALVAADVIGVGLSSLAAGLLGAVARHVLLSEGEAAAHDG